MKKFFQFRSKNEWLGTKKTVFSLGKNFLLKNLKIYTQHQVRIVEFDRFFRVVGATAGMTNIGQLFKEWCK